MSSRTRSSLPRTASGTHLQAFGVQDWTLLAGVAAIWGSSFLLISVGLEHFEPGVVTLARVSLGALTMALLPDAHRPIDRSDWGRVMTLGVVWMAVPLLLFPIAQQWVSSAVSGMLNGGVPIAALLWAAVLLRRPPGRRQAIGIAVGFLGMVAVFLPELTGSSATALGAVLILVSVVLYGLATNLAVPLQQKYGPSPVLLRAELTALVIVLPFGLMGLPGSSWDWASALAMVPLGVLGTAVAFVLMVTLAGRVGGPRASLATYFVPLVAIVLGVVVLHERLDPASLAGVVLIIAGAALASRSEA